VHSMSFNKVRSNTDRVAAISSAIRHIQTLLFSITVMIELRILAGHISRRLSVHQSFLRQATSWAKPPIFTAIIVLSRSKVSVDPLGTKRALLVRAKATSWVRKSQMGFIFVRALIVTRPVTYIARKIPLRDNEKTGRPCEAINLAVGTRNLWGKSLSPFAEPLGPILQLNRAKFLSGGIPKALWNFLGVPFWWFRG